MSESLLGQLQTYAAQSNSKVSMPRKGETFIEVDQDHIKDFISHLVNDFRILHLATITGLDLGENIGIIYHLSQDKDTIYVRSIVPKAKSTAVSIVEVIPGAILYEMEIHDLFGVTFTGNPWINQKLLLPDNWPADLPPPLLKSSKPAEIRKRLQLEVERK
ncbi:MAG TPA: NADH-quinone oxidoreductase subunit C [Candidatus Acidoferrales bacterium]|nr:NADH-quinone oxidoreductase subunit C [Candidatus Acidoferrales bacterium]